MCRLFFDTYLWLYKFSLFKIEGILSNMDLKSPISCDKSMILYGISLTRQNKQYFINLKDLLGWIPKYKTWKLIWSCFVSTTLYLKILTGETRLFLTDAFLLNSTSMIWQEVLTKFDRSHKVWQLLQSETKQMIHWLQLLFH